MNPRTPLFIAAASLQVALLLAMAFSPMLPVTAKEGDGHIRLTVEPASIKGMQPRTSFRPRFHIAQPTGDSDWEGLPANTPVCLILRPGDDGFHEVYAVRTSWPWRVPRDAVVLRGFTTERGIALDGLQQHMIFREMRQVARDAPPQPHAEVSVTREGRGRIQAMVVDGYRY